MAKNVSDKPIIAVHVKRPRAKGFVDLTGGAMHYEDTPEGLSQAKAHLTSLVSGNASYRGHTFKLVRQSIRTTTSAVKNKDGSVTNSSTTIRTPAQDIPDAEINANSLSNPIEAEAREHDDFLNNVSSFVNSEKKNARGENKPNWQHLGFSSAAAMIGSRKPGEHHEDFTRRHTIKLKETLGGIRRAAERWGTQRLPGTTNRRGRTVPGKYDPETKASPLPKKPAVEPIAPGTRGPSKVAERMIERTNAKRGRPAGSKNTTKPEPKKGGRPATKPGPKRTTQRLAKRNEAAGRTAKGQTASQKQVSKLNARAARRGTIKPPTIF
jgi:hypothetical protein